MPCDPPACSDDGWAAWSQSYQNAKPRNFAGSSRRPGMAEDEGQARRRQAGRWQDYNLAPGNFALAAWIYVSQVQLLLCVLELFASMLGPREASTSVLYQPAETLTHRRHRLRRARRQYPIGPPYVFAMDVPGRTPAG